MVPKARKCFGSPVYTEIIVTQGDLVSLTIFNVVDAVVREVLLKLFEPQEAHHGFRWSAGKHNICFCVDYGKIEGRNPIWFQMTQPTMVSILERVGIQKIWSKPKQWYAHRDSFGANREQRRTR